MVVEEHGIEQRRALGIADLEVALGARLRGRAAGDGRGDVGLGEVLEPLDHGQHDREEDHRADGRQRHPAQALERAGAVELGRLVEVLGHVEHGGEEDDHRVADAPEREQHERGLGPRRVVEPQRPVDAGLAEQRVDRPGGGIEQVDEAERRGDRRDQRGQVEDGAEEADALLAPRQHHGQAEREQHLQRHHEDEQPERVADRGPDLRIGAEQVAVVREPDPARRAEQVVVREREVRVHHERVAEEDGEPDEPGAHEQQHGPAAAHRRPPLRPPAVGRRSRGALVRPGCRRDGHGTPPPVCFSFASICLSSSARSLARSLALPDCHLAR